MPSYEPINALLRGLAVMEEMTMQEEVSLKELHSRTQIPKPTLVRIIETLISAGYVYSAGEPLRYSLSPRCLTLASGVSRVRILVNKVGTLLSQFQSSIHWPSDLSVFDHDAMVIVETSRTPGMLSVNRQVGSRVPAVATSLGRAYLAHLADNQRLRTLTVLQELTGEPDNIPTYERLLASIRAKGYSTSDQEHHFRVRAIAAPIFDHGGVVGSINIIALAEAISMEEFEGCYAGQLIEIAKRMSELVMGGEDMARNELTGEIT